MTATILATLQEFIDLPDDGVRRELVRGEVREVSPTQLRHSKVLGHLLRRIGNWAHEGNHGMYGSEGGFLLQEHPPTLLAPDVHFIAAARVPADAELDAFASFAPDLAVEIVSPSNRTSEMADKVNLYLGAGTRTVWVVDPQVRQITVYTPDKDAHIYAVGETIHGGDVLPGFSFAVADAFA